MVREYVLLRGLRRREEMNLFFFVDFAFWRGKNMLFGWMYVGMYVQRNQVVEVD